MSGLAEDLGRVISDASIFLFAFHDYDTLVFSLSWTWVGGHKWIHLSAFES